MRTFKPKNCDSKLRAYIQCYWLFGPRLLNLIVHHSVVDSKSAEYHKCLHKKKRRKLILYKSHIYCKSNPKALWNSCKQSFKALTSNSLWSASLKVFLSSRFKICATPETKQFAVTWKLLSWELTDNLGVSYQLSDEFDSRWEHITLIWCETLRPDLPVEKGCGDQGVWMCKLIFLVFKHLLNTIMGL